MNKAHFIGICGAGMSAVAKLLKDSGWQISGSDEGFYPPVSDFLEKNKIPFSVGYKKENIPEDVDLIVIGKHAKLVPEDNEEVRVAMEMKAIKKSFAEVLGDISKENENIIVAGSYGKSTCTAITSWCLESSGLDPSYFMGAIPFTPSESSKKGTGKFFVLEGDEYPSSNWDNSSKFLHYHPNHLLLTSLTHDHLNIFKTHEDYKAPFKKLILLIPPGGIITACSDDNDIKNMLGTSDKNIVFYGLNKNAPWHADNIKLGEVSSFDLIHDGKLVTTIGTTLLGVHNIENIVGVSALLLSLEIITLDQLVDSLASFKALNRRLDRKSDESDVPIYEGFGSSYAKAKSAMTAIKNHFPEREIAVIFEPHTFSWRNHNALPWYDNVFEGANHVLIYKPPEHGIDTHQQLTLAEIVDRVSKSGVSVSGFEDPKGVSKLLKQSINKNSVVLILSSGGFDGIIENTVSWLEEEFPKK